MNLEELRLSILNNLEPHYYDQQEIKDLFESFEISKANFSSIGTDLIREALPPLMFRESRTLFKAVWEPCEEYFKENPSSLRGNTFLFNALLGEALFKQDGYFFNRIHQFHANFVAPCISAESIIIIGSHTPRQNEKNAPNAVVFSRYHSLYEKNLTHITSDSLAMKSSQKFKIWNLMQSKMTCRRFYQTILLNQQMPYIFINRWVKGNPSLKDQTLFTSVLMDLPRKQLVELFGNSQTLKCLEELPSLKIISNAILENKLLNSVNKAQPAAPKKPGLMPGRF